MIGSRLLKFELLGVLLLAMTMTSTLANAAAPTKELPRMENPALSPDGRHVAYLSRDTSGNAALELINLDRDDARSRVLDGGAVDGGVLDWCGWGNSERLLCGFHGRGNGDVSGIVAVNPDGSGMRMLVRQVRPGGDERTRPQVIDWKRDDLKSVLIQLYATGEAYPAVQRLDFTTGALEVVVAAQAPIQHFMFDEYGEVRFGWGEERKGAMAGYSRLGQARMWRGLKWERLKRFPPTGLQPISGRRIYDDSVSALGPYQDGECMFSVDLTDQSDPARNTGGAYGTGKAQLFRSPKGEFLGMAFPAGDRPPLWFNGRLQNVIRMVGEELPGRDITVIDYVDNPSRFIVRSQRSKEPARIHFYGIAGGPFELRELGRVEPGPLLEPTGSVAAAPPPTSNPAASGTEDLDILITVLDPAKAPVKGLPMRVVLSSDPDWRAPEAGKRYVTDERGRVRDGLKVRMESRRVGLDIPLVTHKAVGFEIGIEIGIEGMPLLYTLTLDEVKKARATLISDTQVYTRAADGSFTREVDLTWNTTNAGYTLPPRDPKTFDRLPNPPPFRLTERNLQLLPHPKADGTNRWVLDLRLSLEPYRPRPGG